MGQCGAEAGHWRYALEVCPALMLEVCTVLYHFEEMPALSDHH